MPHPPCHLPVTRRTKLLLWHPAHHLLSNPERAKGTLKIGTCLLKTIGSVLYHWIDSSLRYHPLKLHPRWITISRLNLRFPTNAQTTNKDDVKLRLVSLPECILNMQKLTR